jgi:hypothetical protein
MLKKIVFLTLVGLVVVGSLFLYTEWKEEQRRREGIERVLGRMNVELALANSKIMTIEQALSDPEMHKLFYGPHGVHRPKTIGDILGQKDRPRTIGEVPQLKEKEKMGFMEKFLLKEEIKREIMNEIELQELMKRGGK